MPRSFHAIRTQNDEFGDEASDEAAYTPEGESLTRQELAAETDIHYILAQHGVNAMQRQGAMFETVDYTTDLQQSYAHLEQLRGSITNLPPELQEKYQTAQQLLTAVRSGELAYDMDQASKKAAFELQKAQDEAAKAAKTKAEQPPKETVAQAPTV